MAGPLLILAADHRNSRALQHAWDILVRPARPRPGQSKGDGLTTRRRAIWTPELDYGSCWLVGNPSCGPAVDCWLRVGLAAGLGC